MKVKIKDIEKAIGYRIKKNFKSVGIDTAQTTGIAFLKSDEVYIHIDSIVLGFKTKDKKEIYSSMVKTFERLFIDEDLAIVEEVFVGFSRAGSVELAKYGALAISELIKKDIKYETISAVSARAKFKINTFKYGKGKSKLAVADFLKSIKIDVTDDNIADCYDKETEILTDQGWKYFKDLDKTEKVFSMNIANNEASYQKISKIIKQKYTGKMFYYKSQTCNFCVTPNHKMILRTTKTPDFIKNNKKTVIIKDKNTGKFLPGNTTFTHSNKWKWRLQDISETLTSYFWMPRTCDWCGIKTKIYKIPELNRNCTNVKNGNKNYDRLLNKNYFWKERKIDITEWLKFLGWYVSEGNLLIAKNGNANGCFITQIKNRTYINEIEDILKNLRFNYTKKKKGFLISNAQIAEHLQNICYDNKQVNCYNKICPNFVKKLSSNLIDVFLESFNKGDGWRQRNSRHYSTSSRKLANDLQELIIKIGKCSSVISTLPDGKKRWYKDHYIETKSIIYRVVEYKYRDVHIKTNEIQKIDYDDLIYCVETNPYNSVLVRRNGQIMWSGNSIVLSLLGICEGIDFTPKPRPKKKRVTKRKKKS